MEYVTLEGVDARGKPKTSRVVRVKPGSEELFPIGHENVSKTFFPGVRQSNAFGEEWALIDCPGFLDNRGEEINIANAVNIKNALSHFDEVCTGGGGGGGLARSRCLRTSFTLWSDASLVVKTQCDVLSADANAFACLFLRCASWC